MTKKSRCCVPNCDRLEPTVHRFPIYYEEVYNIWLERIRLKKLFDMHPIKVNKNYMICDKHFSEECKIPNSKRLKVYSLPSLHLPGSGSIHGEYTKFALPSCVAPSLTEQIPCTSFEVEECTPVAENSMDTVAEIFIDTPVTGIHILNFKHQKKTS